MMSPILINNFSISLVLLGNHGYDGSKSHSEFMLLFSDYRNSEDVIDLEENWTKEHTLVQIWHSY